MTSNEAVGFAAAGAVFFAFILCCWAAKGYGERRGYDRGRAETPPCGHPPCPLIGQRVRVEIAAGPPTADVSRTYALPAGVVEAARTEAEERLRASGSWGSPDDPKRRKDDK